MTASISEAVADEIKTMRKLITREKGIIRRRNTAILFAQKDIQESRRLIWLARQKIIDLGGKVK